VEHGLSLLPGLEERWCLDLYSALHVPASSTASRAGCPSLSRRTIEKVKEDGGNKLAWDAGQSHHASGWQIVSLENLPYTDGDQNRASNSHDDGHPEAAVCLSLGLAVIGFNEPRVGVD